MVTKGLSWKFLKKNPSLLPLIGFVGLGVFAAIGYTVRVAVKNPEISINKRGNPEPWNEYKNKQYKFYASEEQKNQKCLAPEY